MQLADRGPEMRFMTSMAVLYQGKSFVIKPWTLKGKRAELIAHFEALGAKVNIDAPNWTFTIELCAQHSISFATRHSDGINFLNLEVSVPGCHDAYGGLLGQTYQCKYAHEKFEWSREREEAFRVATLETASDMYSPLATCAHEDEYRGGSDPRRLVLERHFVDDDDALSIARRRQSAVHCARATSTAVWRVSSLASPKQKVLKRLLLLFERAKKFIVISCFRSSLTTAGSTCAAARSAENQQRTCVTCNL
jgi:hypothetical protein